LSFLRAALLAVLLAAGTAGAAPPLPDLVNKDFPGLKELGEGRLRFIGIHVYDASVWIPGAAFSAKDPYALELRYAISINGHALTLRSTKEMRGQGYTDEAKLSAWEKEMDRVFPDLKPATAWWACTCRARKRASTARTSSSAWWPMPSSRAPSSPSGSTRRPASRPCERSCSSCRTEMRRASALQLAAYGILGFPLAMAALPIYVHVPHFYSDTLGLSLASVGGLLLAARFLDAVQDPLLGWWSDRRRDRPGGRWVFVLAGAPLLALGMVGLFNPPDWPGSQLGIWLIANLIIVYTAYSLVTVSYQAYGAEISDDVSERTRVTAWREGFALLGVFLAAALPEILKKEMGERAGFAQFAWVFVPIVIVATVLAWWGSPPAVAKPAPVDPRVFAAMMVPFRNPKFRRLALVFVLNGIAASIPATLVLFFIEDVVKRSDLTAVFLIAYFRRRRRGAARLGVAGAPHRQAQGVAGRHGCLDPGLRVGVPARRRQHRRVLRDLRALRAGAGADLALPPSILADVIDDDEARGLGRSEGAYFGLWNLATKMNLALAAGARPPAPRRLRLRSEVRQRTRSPVRAVRRLRAAAVRPQGAAALALWRDK
jgi:Na+/melibiose symporter-like transporter